MKYLLDMFRALRKNIEDNPSVQAEDLRAIVSDLDDRTRFILEQLNYDPNNVPRTSLFKETPDRRKQIAEEHLALLQTNPYRLLPYAVSYLCSDISNRIDADLLMHMGDPFFSGQRLRFFISTSTFGMSFSSFSPVSDKNRIQAKLAELKASGLEVKDGSHGDLVIPLCDTNISFLTKYCEEVLCARVSKMEDMRGNISRIFLTLDPERYTAQTPVQKQPQLGVLDEDCRAVLIKEIKHAEDTLCSYQMMANMGQGDMMLSLIKSEVFSIEERTGLHFQIYQDKIKTLGAARKANAEVFNMEDTIKQQAFQDMNWETAKKAFSDFQDRLDKLAKELGLFVDQIQLGEHRCNTLILHPDSIRRSTSGLRQDMDIIVNDQIGVSVQDSDSNLAKIQLVLQQAIPGLELESVEISFRSGRRSITSLRMRWYGILPV